MIPYDYTVGMIVRNKHTGDEAEIVSYNTIRNVRTFGRLSNIVYTLEYENGKRDNWNAVYMKHWEIVPRKILSETEEGDEEE